MDTRSPIIPTSSLTRKITRGIYRVNVKDLIDDNWWNLLLLDHLFDRNIVSFISKLGSSNEGIQDKFSWVKK